MTTKWTLVVGIVTGVLLTGVTFLYGAKSELTRIADELKRIRQNQEGIR